MDKTIKTAIITGITGQDGSYLAEFLLDKGYRVIGLKRRTSLICTSRLDGFYNHPNFEMRYFDLNDSGCMWRLLTEYKPDEIYNLAAQSHGNPKAPRGYASYCAKRKILSGVLL